MASRERDEKGSQRGAKRRPKQAKRMPKLKRHLQKHPLQNNWSEQVRKKDVKMMTMYAERVPQVINKYHNSEILKNQKRLI